MICHSAAMLPEAAVATRATRASGATRATRAVNYN